MAVGRLFFFKILENCFFLAFSSEKFINIIEKCDIIYTRGNIMRLYMIIGLPDSGKSRFADSLPGFLHSEEIFRKKHPEMTDNEIYDMMYTATEAALKAKSDVIYDAMNLSRQNRQKILKLAKTMGAETIAVLMLTPIDLCKERFSQRGNLLTEEDIDKLAASFNIPTDKEFDNIKVVQTEIGDDDIELDFSKDDGFFAFSLMRHLRLTEEYLESEDEILKKAARYHDIGKSFVPEHINEKTGDIRYYGHENYSALWYLTTRKVDASEMEVATLINYHMRPFLWEKSEKAKNKDIIFLGEDTIKKLEILHKANLEALK